MSFNRGFFCLSERNDINAGKKREKREREKRAAWREKITSEKVGGGGPFIEAAHATTPLLLSAGGPFTLPRCRVQVPTAEREAFIRVSTPEVARQFSGLL